jgi:hypothetical protein
MSIAVCFMCELPALHDPQACQQPHASSVFSCTTACMSMLALVCWRMGLTAVAHHCSTAGMVPTGPYHFVSRLVPTAFAPSPQHVSIAGAWHYTLPGVATSGIQSLRVHTHSSIASFTSMQLCHLWLHLAPCLVIASNGPTQLQALHCTR